MEKLDSLKKLGVDQLNGDIILRDKVIYDLQNNPWREWSTEDLKVELARCEYKRLNLVKRLMLPFFILISASFLMIIGAVFQILNTSTVFIIIGLGIGIPIIILLLIDHEIKHALKIYHIKIKEIKFELHDRKIF